MSQELLISGYYRTFSEYLLIGGASLTSLPLLILIEVLASVTILFLQLKIYIYYAEYTALQAHL